MKTELEVKAGIQIQKPVHEVFEAIADPAHMTNYWISKSSGRMEEGETLQWEFPEFEGAFPVRIGKVVNDELLTFYWEHEGRELRVEFRLLPEDNNSTVVMVAEGTMENNEAGLDWLAGNTEGWANFLACLKAWVEHRINLRKGAFDYRFKNMQ